MKPVSTDVIIVGAGPIGIELAFVLKKAGIDYIQFEKGQIGQTISWFPRLMRFFSSSDRIAIAGVPIPRTDQSKCSKEEYLAYLRTVVIQFALKIHSYELVNSVESKPRGGFVVRTSHFGKDLEYSANKVVLAVGDMHEPRLLNIPGEDLPHVSHYFDDPHRYFQQRVLIVGGKNSAVEAALRCFHCGARVAVSYRGREFEPGAVKYWLLPELNGLIKQGKITFYNETVPEKIHVGKVTLSRLTESGTFDVDADFVLLLIGYQADMRLFKMAGVELRDPGDVPVFHEQTMETNVAGLYVAGTAAAGTQKSFSLFIENCHIHVERIRAALTGSKLSVAPESYTELES